MKSDRPRVVILYQVDSHSILLPLVVLRTIAFSDLRDLTDLPTILLIKHRERFQTRIAQSFEQLLMSANVDLALSIPATRHDIADK